MEEALQEKPWEHTRENVRVKLHETDESELYIYVESADRVAKERSMRRCWWGSFAPRLPRPQSSHPTGKEPQTPPNPNHSTPPRQ